MKEFLHFLPTSLPHRNLPVNASYAETGDIRETMRELRLPFDVVWEMVGYADYFAFEVDED